jgi:hypothetical protein
MTHELGRVVGAVMTALLALGIGAVPSAQAAEPGAVKFRTYGPDGNARCDGSGIVSGHITSFGNAIINEVDGTVSATVIITGGSPNTRYAIRLIQGLDDCHDADRVVRTNGQGIAVVHFSEPVAAGADGAFIAIFTGLTGAPVHVTQTYHY